jgi:hypothetical protein
VFRATKQIIDVLAIRQARATEQAGESNVAELASKPLIIGCAAVDEADVLVLRMLQQLLLDSGRCTMEVLGSDLLFSEMASIIEQKQPAVVCVSAVPPGGLTQSRYIGKRLRTQFPQLKIVAGRWCLEEKERNAEVLKAAGADRVTTTLLETRKEVFELMHLVPGSETPDATEGEATA